MKSPLVCWKCGAPLEEVPLPLSRRAQCPACEAEQHVCRMCEFYDPRIKYACREERADEVREKELANFCDYFKPRPNAYVRRDDTKALAAKANLDGLFGEGEVLSQTDAARERFEELFGGTGKKPR